MISTALAAPLAPLHQLLVCTENGCEGATYLICDPNLPTPNDIACTDDPHVAVQFAASGPMLVALETTRANLLSMMPAIDPISTPEPYRALREWLSVVEEALAAARDTESIR